ncbi:MAG: G5 domain-containing protein [Anaerolineales bacterium]|nr:G5 domain-containing protein [Anaerolineales bacterium]
MTYILFLFLTACQSFTSSITIMDGDQTYQVDSSDKDLIPLLTQAGVILGINDRILVNGIETPLDQTAPTADSLTIQIRRAVTLTLNTPDGSQTISTSALTVGQALSEAGFTLTQNDLVAPSAETPITQAMTVTFRPARDLTILVGENAVNIRSAAETVGEALAEAGIPLIGFDTSFPLESEALPSDGQIRVVRVYESVSVALKPIPFQVEVTDSVDVAFGEEEIIQPGVEGIAMVRTRIRYEDGKEVSRTTEGETVMRQPQNRIVASGSKIVLAPVGGDIPYEYWYATEMYASVYSPCASGTGGCSYGTASGARAGQGIVAVDYSIYSYLAGMQVYIPGYGIATIGDTGGGPIIETAFGVPRTKWIDLGFNEGELRNMTGWVTVYFLAPAPAEIPYFLK